MELAAADAEKLADRARGVPAQNAPYHQRKYLAQPDAAGAPCKPGAAQSAEQSYAEPAFAARQIRTESAEQLALSARVVQRLEARLRVAQPRSAAVRLYVTP